MGDDMLLDTLKEKQRQLARDIPVLLKNPREYLFSFTYSNKKTVSISKFDPTVHRFGERLVEKIERHYPQMNVQLFGSTSLKIAGQRDIDLLIECPRDDLSKYSTALTSLFGTPAKTRNRFSEWALEEKGCSIQILLIQKDHPIARKLRETNDLLQKNKAYREQYEAVKLAADGVSEREYARRRLKFFCDIGI
jgi:GrpB-like predicted nucleotidyltransferase (UPF0157 family)